MFGKLLRPGDPGQTWGQFTLLMPVFFFLIINLVKKNKKLEAKITYFPLPCCSRVSMLGAVWGPNAGRTLYWVGECVWGYIMWLGVKEYPTPPWIPHPTPHFRQGCPVTSTCAEQNRGLVQFFSAAPHLCLPPVSSPPKFYLKLDLLKGLLEFHGNLCGSKTHHDIFPYSSQDQECEQWIQGWIMISGFSLPPPLTVLFWGCCQTRGSLPQGLLKACCVEGLLLGGEEPRLPLESCLSSSIQYGGHEGGAGSPAWGRTLVSPCRTSFWLFQKKEKQFFFSRKILKVQPRPPPAAWALREVGCSVNGDVHRQTSQAL